MSPATPDEGGTSVADCREAPQDSRRTQKRWPALLRAGISIGLIGYLLSMVSISEIADVVVGSSRQWPLLLVASILPAIGILIAAFRWQSLLAGQGVRISVMRLCEATLVGAFYNQILPSTIGGDIVRGWWVTDPTRCARGEAPGYSSLVLNLTVVGVDRLMGLLGICATACIAASISPTVVKQLPGVWALLAIASLAIVLFVLISFLPSGAAAGVAFLRRRLPRIEFIVRTLIVYRGHKSRLWWACALSVGLQSLIIIQYWLLADAFGSNVSIWSLSVVVPVVTLLSLAPVTINGIGIRENALAVLVAPFGLSAASAIVLAWTVVFITLVYASLGGLLHLRGRHSREPLPYLVRRTS